jgi:hypothetical protein
MTARSVRLLAAVGSAVLLACGVKAPPRPPLREDSTSTAKPKPKPKPTSTAKPTPDADSR